MTSHGAVRTLARPLTHPGHLDPLLERIGGASVVLLGEASHGTAEYYRWRAEISRRLITEQGFSFVAVEGDWPDCYELNRCVKHDASLPSNPRQVLERFDRWPTWMWANEEVVDFASWLRRHNSTRAPDRRVGFYGLDVYSLWESMLEILGYLKQHEPEHVEAALQAWHCFEPYGQDPQQYARATRFVPTSCEDAVVNLLAEVRRAASGHGATGDGGHLGEERLNAEQNAAVAAGAERYYRAMIRGGGESWNVRDRHMAETLARLLAHRGRHARAIVWAHNTHIGDARATDMADAGMTNLGQLVRERHDPDDVVLVGFGGYAGTVIASTVWGGPMARMPVPPARSGSAEALLHDAGLRHALFTFPRHDRPAWLRDRLDHRAIGVVYSPERERFGNYVPSVLGRRYDAFCFFDDTAAVSPVGASSTGTEAETFPSGR